ncbi:MAG TPA: Xaa-Pro peptidase family protein [Actinomycetota bacterium]|nr:Xaa-Pro peptidase family protein [Actinomycetota bacterium]
MTSERHLERMRRARDRAAERGLSGVLVSPSPDYRYLAGYDPPPLERLTLLAVRARADPVLLVPELEAPLARASPVGEAVEVVTWADGEDPYAAAARLVPPDGAFAVGERMWARHLLGLQAALPGARFEPAGSVLAPLRAVKDPDELELLGRAARAADAAFRRLVGERRLEGRREEEVADELGALLLEAGHESVAFTIVGSGPNGASPHHDPGSRTIRRGDAVVLDFGGRVGGYCSDITRTVTVGEPPPTVAEIHEVVREAQEAAFRAVRPGIPAAEVDRAARDVIAAAGYGERFVHRTGHGIGLEEHEEPYIVAGNDRPLEVGNCFSLEPGIYLPGAFGVRIEDIVTLTPDGPQRLNHAPRELLAVA